MKEPRPLTSEEISVLESYGCWAEDWSSVVVAEGFSPKHLNRVLSYDENCLGAFEEMLEVVKGFFKHSGITSAILRNVTVGDSSPIENVGNYINNCATDDSCFISDIYTLETTGGATYDEGNAISVLNEVGDGNVVLFRELNSQFAAFVVQHLQNEALRDAVLRLIKKSVALNESDQARVGNHMKIVNTKEIIDTIVFDDCGISGASRLSDCMIFSSEAVSACIRTGVIYGNSITSHGSPIINGVKMRDCFVGETCQIANDFTVSPNIFFVNSYMVNGKACVAFCGPFSSSHYKSNLLIGGIFSFYSVGSAINLSNHAYKMGPMHYGVLQRGCKTTNGAYLPIPVNIGTLSVYFGKLMYHPGTRSLPLSYLIAYGDIMYLSPRRNIAIVGFYRDINK